MPTDNNTAPEVKLAQQVLKAFRDLMFAHLPPAERHYGPSYENSIAGTIGPRLDKVLARCERIVKKAEKAKQ